MAVLNEASQSAKLRTNLIKRLEDHYNAKVVTFFTSFTDREAQILDDDAEMFESVLSSEHNGGPLVVVINSPGGQALAAERIVNVCRSHAGGKFEVIVPHMAKSAATMICFGASRINMGPTAELGPVDPQVPFWRDGASEDDPPDWISAEEYIRSYDDLLMRASDGRAKRIEPFLQQLQRYDARHIERLRSIRKLSTDISVRLLKSSMMPKRSEKAIAKSIDVFLSQQRTSAHGRMINATEAKNCGLNIGLIDLQSETWHTVWELYVRSDWAVSRTCKKVVETSLSAVQV